MVELLVTLSAREQRGETNFSIAEENKNGETKNN
jgi:hypothetical protein